jgi:hypothetical protein
MSTSMIGRDVTCTAIANGGSDDVSRETADRNHGVMYGANSLHCYHSRPPRFSKAEQSTSAGQQGAENVARGDVRKPDVSRETIRGGRLGLPEWPRRSPGGQHARVMRGADAQA